MDLVLVACVVVGGYFAVEWLNHRGETRDDRKRDQEKWRHDDGNREIRIDFSSMTCTICIHAAKHLDGEAWLRISDEADKDWQKDSENLEAAGWTKTEFTDVGRSVLDLRRTAEGIWQQRYADRYWRRKIAKLEAGFDRLSSQGRDADEYKRLTGEDYELARARHFELDPLVRRVERGEIPVSDANPLAGAIWAKYPSTRRDSAPWEPIGDFERLVETGYQRHIHRK